MTEPTWLQNLRHRVGEGETHDSWNIIVPVPEAREALDEIVALREVLAAAKLLNLKHWHEGHAACRFEFENLSAVLSRNGLLDAQLASTAAEAE